MMGGTVQRSTRFFVLVWAQVNSPGNTAFYAEPVEFQPQARPGTGARPRDKNATRPPRSKLLALRHHHGGRADHVRGAAKLNAQGRAIRRVGLLDGLTI